MTDRFDPFSVHLKARAFLYNSILLPWETKTISIRQENINKQKLFAAVKFPVEYFNTLGELEAKEQALPNELSVEDQFLYFHNETKSDFSAGYACLFKRLRDTVAHGHFGSSGDGLISICHRYSPNKNPEKTRIVGRLTLPRLTKLIAFIGQSDQSSSEDSAIAVPQSIRRKRS